MIDPTLPRDLRDLLVALGVSTEKNFENTNEKIADIKTDLVDFKLRQTALEDRIITIERWQTAHDGKLEGASKMGAWIKGGVTAIGTICAMLGIQFMVAPDKPAPSQPIAIQQSVPVAK